MDRRKSWNRAPFTVCGFAISTLVVRLALSSCFTDPDTNNCDDECGMITAENIVYHVPCRLQCVLPDFAGSLLILYFVGDSFVDNIL